jgi:CheY-like chemotaxis protein/anti-sigma regulatory factor (Ser/Thr protein kinase)
MHERHGLTVVLSAHGEVEPAAEDVSVLFFQAARELLFNIVKHAGVKAARMKLTRVDRQIQLTVADEGGGFDPLQLRAEGGSSGGFGLFSVRERLNLLGGRMGIDSAPGQGCRITLITPPTPMVGKEAPASAGKEPKVSVGITPVRTAAVAGAEGRIRIVLVDDHMLMRQGLARLLREERDMEIVGEASDGASAVSLVRETQPDVVLMDVNMPGMNGTEATRIIHAELPEINVIGLSMFEEAELATAMRKAGAVNYLSKSGASNALIAAIRACATGLGQKIATGTS